MFHFLQIHARDWGIWRRIDSDAITKNIIVVAGPNNSGKTSLADGLLTLLGSERLFGKRSIAFYVRDPAGGKRSRVALIMAHVSNYAGARNQRPFTHMGIRSDVATIAVAIVIRSGIAEREFFIGPGSLSVQEMQTIYQGKRSKNEQGEWMGLRDWQSRVMEPAQCSPKQLERLAVDSREVEDICSKQGHGVYEIIERKLFDSEVLRNYKESLESLQAATKALRGVEKNLNDSKDELDRLKRQSDLLAKWGDADVAIVDAEKNFVAAEYAEAFRNYDVKETVLKTVNHQLRSTSEQLAGTRDQKNRIDAHESSNLKAKAAAKLAADAAEKVCTSAYDAKREADDAENKRAFAEAQVKASPKVPLAQAEKTYAASDEAFQAARDALRSAEANHGEWRLRVESLKSNIIPLPVEVRRTHEELKAAGLKFESVTETIDLPFQDAPYVEAALGNLRFTIVVDAKDESNAVRIAAKTGFPGPIYAGKTLAKKTHAGQATAQPGTPQAMQETLTTLQVGKDRADSPHGAWATAVAQTYLTKSSIKQQLAEATTQLAAALEGLETANAAHMEAKATRDSANEVLNLVRQAVLHRKVMEELRDAPKRVKEAAKNLESADGVLRSAKEDYEKADRALAAISGEKRRIGEELRRIDAENTQKQQEAEKVAIQVEDAEKTLAAKGDSVDSLLKVRIKGDKGAFMEVANAKTQVTRAKNERSKLPPRPEASVAVLVERQEKHVAAATTELAARQHNQVAAEKQTTEKRNHYLEWGNPLFQQYKARLENLGEKGSIAIEVDVPKFTKETTDDDIAKASVEVRLGYDEKAPLWHGHESFSQGQKYLNSLVVVLGLAEAGEEGFFVMDEPTQNLSADRVNLLFKMMRNTGAQYFLCIPTNLDPETYKGVAHLIVLTRPDSTGYAMAPAIIGA